MPSSAAVVSFAFSGGSPGMITMPFGPCSSNTLLNQNLDTLLDMNLQNSEVGRSDRTKLCSGIELKGCHVSTTTN